MDESEVGREDGCRLNEVGFLEAPFAVDEDESDIENGLPGDAWLLPVWGGWDEDIVTG